MILVLASLVPVCGLIGVGLLVHRDLVRIGDSVDCLPAGVKGRLNEFWGEITDMNAGHAKAVDDRYAGLEHALGETRRSQGELARTVSWAAGCSTGQERPPLGRDDQVRGPRSGPLLRRSNV